MLIPEHILCDVQSSFTAVWAAVSSQLFRFRHRLHALIAVSAYELGFVGLVAIVNDLSPEGAPQVFAIGTLENLVLVVRSMDLMIFQDIRTSAPL